MNTALYFLSRPAKISKLGLHPGNLDECHLVYNKEPFYERSDHLLFCLRVLFRRVVHTQDIFFSRPDDRPFQAVPIPAVRYERGNNSPILLLTQYIQDIYANSMLISKKNCI